jgi:hypothetical protein
MVSSGINHHRPNVLLEHRTQGKRKRRAAEKAERLGGTEAPLSDCCQGISKNG